MIASDSDLIETPSTVVKADPRRIVVKVGSSLVTNEGRGIDEDVPSTTGAARLAAAGRVRAAR